MYTVFEWLAYIANLIAIVTLLFIIGNAVNFHLKEKTMPPINEVNTYINYCKVAGVIFLFCSWLTVNEKTPELIAATYQAISDDCLFLGKIWICVALVDICAAIFVSLKKELATGNSKIVIDVFRNSTLGIGIIYFVMAFLLSIR